MKSCRQCEKDFSQIQSSQGYNWNGYEVCESCYTEISDEVGKGWKYEDFWQVEQKYPRIFNPAIYRKTNDTYINGVIGGGIIPCLIVSIMTLGIIADKINMTADMGVGILICGFVWFGIITTIWMAIVKMFFKFFVKKQTTTNG